MFVEHFLAGAVGKKLFLSYKLGPSVGAFVGKLKKNLGEYELTVFEDGDIPAGTASLNDGVHGIQVKVTEN